MIPQNLEIINREDSQAIMDEYCVERIDD